MNNERTLFDIQQIADVVGLEPKTIRLWCQKNYFESAIKLGKGKKCQWRVPSDDLYLSQLLETCADATHPARAVQTSEMARLNSRIEQLETDYQKLMNAYNVSLSEADDLEKELHQVGENYNKLMKIHKETSANHQAQIADLQQYKNHYEDQKQKRQNGQRRAA